MSGFIQFVMVPGWRIEWCSDARYYGRRWCLHLGPWLIFIWPCSAAEMEAYGASLRKTEPTP